MGNKVNSEIRANGKVKKEEVVRGGKKDEKWIKRRSERER